MQTCFDIYAFSITLQHPAPTQVVLQVVRRHAMEPLHPLFQPMVIPVYVLDVIRTDHPFALTIAHHLMGYTLFFAETGVRLLPSTAGRTTMSPTELFYDEVGGSYIRLLAIETRLEDAPLNVLKSNPARWKQINFDPNSSDQMQEVFKELIAVKRVPKADAMKLGLFDDRLAAGPRREFARHVHMSASVLVPARGPFRLANQVFGDCGRQGQRAARTAGAGLLRPVATATARRPAGAARRGLAVEQAGRVQAGLLAARNRAPLLLLLEFVHQ